MYEFNVRLSLDNFRFDGPVPWEPSFTPTKSFMNSSRPRLMFYINCIVFVDNRWTIFRLHLQVSSAAVTIKTRKFMTNKLLARKQMVRIPESNWYRDGRCISLNSIRSCSDRGRPPSRQSFGKENRNPREASENVQSFARRLFCIQLQNLFRWWKIDRFRFNLR